MKYYAHLKENMDKFSRYTIFLGQYSYYTLGFHAHKNTFGKSAAGTLFSVSSTDFTVTISMTSECFIVLDSSFKETFTTFTCENSIVITYKRKFKMHQHNWYVFNNFTTKCSF